MHIEILQLVEGARRAVGLTVIIDVFRAFSTSCYLMRNGARCIIPIADLDLAYKLKHEIPDSVLIGERKGIPLQGAQFGNSPTEIEHEDFSGKTVILTTSAGTQGFRSAAEADELLAGSLVNADAIVRYIHLRSPDRVSLVCMGLRALEPCDEDTLCAEYIRDRLEGRKVDREAIVRRLRLSAHSGKFFDESKTWAPERDFHLCTRFDQFDFVLKLEPSADGVGRLVSLPVSC